MAFQDYPRWIFHRDHPMVLVNNEEEEAALGAGWTRSYPPPEPEPAPLSPSPEEPAPDEKRRPAKKRS